MCRSRKYWCCGVETRGRDRSRRHSPGRIFARCQWTDDGEADRRERTSRAYRNDDTSSRTALTSNRLFRPAPKVSSRRDRASSIFCWPSVPRCLGDSTLTRPPRGTCRLLKWMSPKPNLRQNDLTNRRARNFANGRTWLFEQGSGAQSVSERQICRNIQGSGYGKVEAPLQSADREFCNEQRLVESTSEYYRSACDRKPIRTSALLVGQRVAIPG